MERLKIVLLVVIAVLLVVQIVDRVREPQQTLELKKSLDRLSVELARGVIQAPAASDPLTAPALDPSAPPPVTSSGAEKAFVFTIPPAPRDGQPQEGVNFLMPYDRSWYNPKVVGGTLRTTARSPKSLNPLTDQSATSSDIHGLCNDSLCSRPPYAPEAWAESLATSCVISDDYQTYTFAIRRGVMWTRPNFASEPAFAWLDKDVELTAHDFVFMLDMIMDPAVDCPSTRAYYEEDLDSWKALDDFTLEMRWKRKVYTSLSASLSLSALPRHIYARNAAGTEIPPEQRGVNFNRHWFDERNAVVGVGAYTIERYEPERILVFRKNPRYWGVSDHFETREWNLALKEPEAILTAFKNGQVSVDGLQPLKYKSEILDHKEKRFAAPVPNDPKAGRKGSLGWERVKSMSFSYIGWNMRRPPFDDVRVRQAMTHAFDKQRMIRDVYFGLGQSVLSDVHPDSAYCNTDLKPYTFDLDKAKALLAEAGWTDSDGDGLLDRTRDGHKETFTFEIKYISQNPEWDNVLAIYRGDLHRIGIDMTPLQFEWSELMRIYEDRDFQAVVGGWRMGWEQDYYQLWHSSEAEKQGSSNHCGFADPKLDELAERLRLTFVTEERIAIVKEIQAILHQAQPYTFFRSGEGIFIWQNHAPEGSDPELGRYLRGVITGLESFHPLTNRASWFWYFPR